MLTNVHPPSVDGRVLIGDVGSLQHSTEVTNVKTDIGRNAEGCRLIFVAINDEPSGFMRLGHSDQPTLSGLQSFLGRRRGRRFLLSSSSSRMA